MLLNSCDAVRADHVLDVEGLFCPIPIARGTERMVQLRELEVLELRATDPGVVIDVPAWCHSAGHEFLGYWKEGGRIRCWIRKGGARALSGGGVPP